MRILHRPWLDKQQKKRSRRQLRNKKKSKWVDDSMSKPTKACRVANHKECPVPDKCPCYCHRMTPNKEDETDAQENEKEQAI